MQLHECREGCMVGAGYVTSSPRLGRPCNECAFKQNHSSIWTRIEEEIHNLIFLGFTIIMIIAR